MLREYRIGGGNLRLVDSRLRFSPLEYRDGKRQAEAFVHVVLYLFCHGCACPGHVRASDSSISGQGRGISALRLLDAQVGCIHVQHCLLNFRHCFHRIREYFLFGRKERQHIALLRPRLRDIDLVVYSELEKLLELELVIVQASLSRDYLIRVAGILAFQLRHIHLAQFSGIF